MASYPVKWPCDSAFTAHVQAFNHPPAHDSRIPLLLMPLSELFPEPSWKSNGMIGAPLTLLVVIELDSNLGK